MKKSNHKQNMLRANQTIQNLHIQNKQTIKEDFDYQPKPIGKEGIEKKIAELARKKNSLEEQRKQITAEIKKLNTEIIKWQTEISPNQLTMFGDI